MSNEMMVAVVDISGEVLVDAPRASLPAFVMQGTRRMNVADGLASGELRLMADIGGQWQVVS